MATVTDGGVCTVAGGGGVATAVGGLTDLLLQSTRYWQRQKHKWFSFC